MKAVSVTVGSTSASAPSACSAKAAARAPTWPETTELETTSTRRGSRGSADAASASELSLAAADPVASSIGTAARTRKMDCATGNNTVIGNDTSGTWRRNARAARVLFYQRH